MLPGPTIKLNIFQRRRAATVAKWLSIVLKLLKIKMFKNMKGYSDYIVATG